MPWCKQCKKEKPDDRFLKMFKRRWAVKKCNTCARANMARWAFKVEMDPDKVAQR